MNLRKRLFPVISLSVCLQFHLIYVRLVLLIEQYIFFSFAAGSLQFRQCIHPLRLSSKFDLSSSIAVKDTKMCNIGPGLGIIKLDSVLIAQKCCPKHEIQNCNLEYEKTNSKVLWPIGQVGDNNYYTCFIQRPGYWFCRTGWFTFISRRQVPHGEQDLLTLPGHLWSPPVFSGHRVVQS